MKTKILLVEDHDIVRQGIRALIENDEQVEVIGEAGNGEEALTFLKNKKPDLILMDMNMPLMNGTECTRRIKKDFPSIKILVLSMHEHENYLTDMLDAGADGYILKNTGKEELLDAIKKVMKGSIYIGPEFTMNLIHKFRSSNGFSVLKRTAINLSDRENDVLQLIAEGMTNSEIAQKLFTSVRTIETRRKKLLEKTGTNNTATLIKYSVQNGLVK
jgi:DNA-binding NarL/FixJ family response regulator